MRLTYGALGVKLTGTLEFCDDCARSKAKVITVRKKTYALATKTRERNFVEMNGPFPEILIGNHYWIGVVDVYS